MKRVLQAIQAVTVELLGVLLVVWMLFGFTAMGLHSASGKPPTLGSDITQRLEVWKERISTRLFRDTPDDTKRQEYVAKRLGYFSQTYSLAARNHVEELFGEFDRDSTVASRRDTRSP